MKQNRIINWFTWLWIAAFLTAGFLYFNWHIDKKYIGIVDRKPHLISSQEPGRIHSLLVQIGDRVQSGQVLAILDISDLKTQLSCLRSELARIENLADVQHNQYLLELQRFKMQLDNEAMELIDRISLIESKSVELESVNALITRLQNAEQAGLGYNSDLAELIIRRDALKAYLQHQSHIDESGIAEIEDLRQKQNKLLDRKELDDMSRAMLIERLEHAEEIRRQIALAEHRINLRTMISPCDGYVTELNIRTGDITQEFIPILTIEESRTRNLTVYISEKSTIRPQIGSSVRIYSNRQRHATIFGRVSFLHPGISLADERLSLQDRIFWARKVDVELPQNHPLIPGEMVYVRFQNRTSKHDVNNKENAVNPASLLREMHIPATLRAHTRCEPSGICRLADNRKYLIISDDTGLENTPSEHAPWLFLMDGDGNIDSLPLPIAGLSSVNDLEAITPVSDNQYYLISSQNISKRGKRPVSREQLLKIQVTEKGVQLLSKVDFLSRLEEDYRQSRLIELGLDCHESDGRPEINIEGIAYVDSVLYIGLKEPISDRGALIWELRNPEKLFQTGHLSASQLKLWAEIPLLTDHRQPGGISDMAIDSQKRLWILSTIPNVKSAEQIGSLYCVTNFPDCPPDYRRCATFPGVKPEGLCFLENKQMLIVFDNDSETPQFAYLDTEGL